MSSRASFFFVLPFLHFPPALNLALFPIWPFALSYLSLRARHDPLSALGLPSYRTSLLRLASFAASCSTTSPCDGHVRRISDLSPTRLTPHHTTPTRSFIVTLELKNADDIPAVQAKLVSSSSVFTRQENLTRVWLLPGRVRRSLPPRRRYPQLVSSPLLRLPSQRRAPD